MALILVFVNKSDLAEISDYDVQVLVGDGSDEHSKTIHQGRHTGHKRSDGWEALVRAYLDTLQAKDCKDCKDCKEKS